MSAKVPFYLDSITINLFIFGLNLKWGEAPSNDSVGVVRDAEALRHIRGHPVVIKAFNEQYVSAHQNGQLVADRPHPAAWEIFELFRLADDKIALRAWNGKFVSATFHPFGQGELIANRPTISGWEAFTCRKLEDGKVSLQAFDKAYITANLIPQGYGELIANRPDVSGWEAFSIENLE